MFKRCGDNAESRYNKSVCWLRRPLWFRVISHAEHMSNTRRLWRPGPVKQTFQLFLVLRGRIWACIVFKASPVLQQRTKFKYTGTKTTKESLKAHDGFDLLLWEKQGNIVSPQGVQVGSSFLKKKRNKTNVRMAQTWSRGNFVELKALGCKCLN